MRKVLENGKIRKTEYNRGEKEYQAIATRFNLFTGINISPNTVSYEEDKGEYSVYINGDRSNGGDPSVVISIKYNKISKKTRTKRYYIGNHLNIDTKEKVFLTGIYDDTGEYTLYVFEDGSMDNIFSAMGYKTFYGYTFTKEGEFIRESKYENI